ncbi:MAG: BatA domain-containing protein [Pirellulales bacterium]|nr:BatA domain-containing protein [Pirellulales bacterium]
MIFTSPLMLLGLAALPVLAAVYWLRSRSQRVTVSSLAFWADQRSPRQGGRILHRMQTPLCFFLELLAIAMLVVAAAGPVLLHRDVVRPLVVVLDDSYSMSACRDAQRRDSPRRRAAAALANELRRNNYAARFIAAGAKPSLIGGPLREPERAEEALAHWTCRSPSADLSSALALAAEVGGREARILVLGDRAPATPLEGGQVEWWAFGEKLPNAAFTAAARSRSGAGQRVVLEVTNLSNSPRSCTLTIESGGSDAADKKHLELDAGAAGRLFLNLPAGAPSLRADIGDDALQIDNRVVLLPENEKPLRVLVDLAEDNLRKAVLRALEATAGASVVSQRPELVVCDKSGAIEGDAWRLEIVGGQDSVAYAGPFVIDHNHELTQGLSLQNVIWSAPSRADPLGLPIVAAGNAPLLTETTDAGGRRRLRMLFAADASNLQDMPDWPILFDNLVRWRRAELPGIAAPNVRLGQTVDVALAVAVERVAVVAPSKNRRSIEVRGRCVSLPAEQVGIYQIETPTAEYQFAANAVSRDESDLSDCRSGRWGNWDDSQIYQDRRIALRWIFLLAAMAAMAAHLGLIAKRAGYA